MKNLAYRFLVSCLFLIAVAPSCSETDTTCDTNNDCSDGLFCTGEATCNSSGRCEPGTAPDCDDGIACTIDECEEISNSCVSLAPDVDDDGAGDASCLNEFGEPLGRDCDDSDPLRFGGNLEVCDVDQVDEDCDTSTFGDVDVDGDGFVSGSCCNRGETQFFCGSDCDDNNVSIFPGAMSCHDDVTQIVKVCGSDGLYHTETCAQQGVCFPQPNGTGVCVPF